MEALLFTWGYRSRVSTAFYPGYGSRVSTAFAVLALYCGANHVQCETKRC